MAKTSEYYAEEGRKAAQLEHSGKGWPKLPFADRGSKSWQAQAYWMAYDDEKARLASSAVLQDSGVIKMSSMAANTRGWPEAAAEHARLLAQQLNEETNPHRSRRLSRALCRLQQRYS